jgi:hypothetical protein
MSEAERVIRVDRLGLRLLPGLDIERTPPDRIALSFVHWRQRIDIPIGAIGRIEALEEFTLWESGQVWRFRSPRVEISVTAAVRARIWQLTKDIIDEPMEIVVAGECVAKPIVREPLGTQERLQISVWDLAEANALADRLRARWSKPCCLRIVS